MGCELEWFFIWRRGKGIGEGEREEGERKRELVGKTYEFIIRLHTSEDQTFAFGRPERGPFSFVLGVDVVGEVLGPVYACGFGVADIGYVVDVAFG